MELKGSMFLSERYHQSIQRRLAVWKTEGYVYFTDKAHPLCSSSGVVYYHRHVMSMHLGRWLRSEEHVHHIDGDRANNDISNLKVLSRSDHSREHCAEPTTVCAKCGTLTYNEVYCSSKCHRISSRKVERPSKEQLLHDIANMSFLAMGKKYGVSDNGVRKWARYYGIELKKRKYTRTSREAV